MDERLREVFLDAYMAAIPLIVLNIVWFICSLPIVTLIPSTAALFYTTNLIAHGKSADWHTFLEGFRKYFWQSWPWGLINVVIFAGLIGNQVFFSRGNADWASAVRGVLLALGIFWLGLQLYTFPLMLEQEQPRLGLALRNSLVILIKRPLFTLIRAIFIGAVVIASTLILWPTWIFVTASVCAWLANRATLDSISKISGRKPSSESAETP